MLFCYTEEEPMEVILLSKREDKIGYNSPQKNVYNKVGNIILPQGANFEFVKDPQSLFSQYSNLIHSLGRQYATYFPQYADKEDLFIYIADAFISLAIEYDPDSGVDFAGYIDTNLRKRIKYSYIQKYYKEKARVNLLRSPQQDVSDIIAAKQMQKRTSLTDKQGNITEVSVHDLNILADYDDTFQALLDEYESVVHLSELDKLILALSYVGYNSPRKINEYIQEHYKHQYSATKVFQAYDDLKTFLKIHYKNQIKG